MSEQGQGPPSPDKALLIAVVLLAIVIILVMIF